MFCPKCAAQNVEGARFCRACGADISLVPQALAGNLPAVRPDDEEGRSGRRHKRGRKEPPTVEKGVQRILSGVGFVLVSLAVFAFMKGGDNWFFWLFLPAFFMFGEGVATIMRAKRERAKAMPPARDYEAVPPPRRASELPAHDPAAYVPPSVTENTTRHLGVRDERLK